MGHAAQMVEIWHVSGDLLNVANVMVLKPDVVNLGNHLVLLNFRHGIAPVV